MGFKVITIALILLLVLTSILFWLGIFIKGMISRKIKLPYVWGLYFSISYIFYFSKRIITDSATDRTFGVIAILLLLAIFGNFCWWLGKISWETIEKSWSIDALDNLIQTNSKGSGSIKLLVKLLGLKNVYNGSITFIFIFPLACFLI